MDNEMITVAMQMILHAGDARAHIADALRDIKAFDFEGAKEKMASRKRTNRISPCSNKRSSRRS